MTGKTPRYVLLTLFTALIVTACRPAETTTTQPAGAAADPVARGQYLATIGGCHDCHTPWEMGEQGPQPDMTRAFSGHPEGLQMPPAPELPPGPWVWVGSGTMTAFAGPWGVSYSANLTPDRETGIGIWSQEQFIRALRSGRHWGEPEGRPILPPMPWFNLAEATDEDLAALYAYAHSLPAIRNAVPNPIMAPPPDGAPAEAPAETPAAAPAP